MASDSPTENQRYACKCLNVQITSSTKAPVSSSPEGTRDSAYKPTFVDDDGIVVTHPQVTVRTTIPANPIPGTSTRCTRFIVLTCLLCRLAVYRVFQTIPLEIQGKESILVPTDNWVEREILKSATGWVEVHKDSIVGDSISQAKASPSYSQSFSLLLPSSPPSSPNTNAETSPSGSTGLPTTWLPALQSLFSPPPFTPSHPIFLHLASIANQESQNLRATAEQRIADFVKAEITVVEARERKLKHQEGLSPNVALSPVSMNNSPLMSVRNFNPVPIHTPFSPSLSVPRTSALSASMATATFHHLNTRRLALHSSGSYGSGSSHTLSKQSKFPVSGTNILGFARNVDDTINTQASYKYFVNLEEEVAKRKNKRGVAMKEQQEAEAGKETKQAPSRADPSGANINGNLEHETVQETLQTTVTEDGSAKHQETPSPVGRDEGKGKVTFDVKPTVIVTEDDGKVEEDVTIEQDSDSGEMVFELDDLDDAECTGVSQHRLLPLLEQAVCRPFQPRKLRSQTDIETSSSLRPCSLPYPSHIRPIRGHPSSHMMQPHPTTITPDNSLLPSVQHGSHLQVTSENDDGLFRPVAANTPSHRGAWTPNSRAWQTFTRRQVSKEVATRDRIPEEGEDTEQMNHVSQPINIVGRSQRPEPLSLSSYRPKTAW